MKIPRMHVAVVALVAAGCYFAGWARGYRAADSERAGQLRALAAERDALLGRMAQVATLYEPCSLQVADGLAAIQAGAALTAAGMPQCAAWMVAGDGEVLRWNAAPGGLVLRTDAHGRPLGPARGAERMPGFEEYALTEGAPLENPPANPAELARLAGAMALRGGK